METDLFLEAKQLRSDYIVKLGVIFKEIEKWRKEHLDKGNFYITFSEDRVGEVVIVFFGKINTEVLELFMHDFNLKRTKTIIKNDHLENVNRVECILLHNSYFEGD